MQRCCSLSMHNADFFSGRWKSQEWSRIDPYGTFMINRGNRILILLHLYCCSKQKLSKILIMNVANLARFHTYTFIQDIIQAFCVFYLYTLYTIGLQWLWDTVSAKKHVVLPNKIVLWHPYLPITATSPQRPLCSVLRVAVMARFGCKKKWETPKWTQEY